MGIYTEYDYLCNELFFVENIGLIKCPTLRDIRKITYRVWSNYIHILTVTLYSYLEKNNLTAKYEALNKSEMEKQTLFRLLLYGNTDLLFGMIRFFVADNLELKFNPDTESINVYEVAPVGDDKYIGHIDNDNFDIFCKNIKMIIGIEESDDKKPRFKSKRAQYIYEKTHQNNTLKGDQNYSLENMIKKYCTHNKVGINILNIWDMTYFQFVTMFGEYCKGRQCDISDAMAANSFSYKKSSEYRPMEYMKKLN